MVRLIHRPIYPLGNCSRYPLTRRLCGSQNLSRHFEVAISILRPPGIEARFIGNPTRSQVGVPVELRLLQKALKESVLEISLYDRAYENLKDN